MRPTTLRYLIAICAARLDEKTLRYWSKRNLLGQRRITQFRKNFYRYGLLGRFIGAGHLITKLYGKDISKFVTCKTMDEQRKFFDSRNCAAV